VFGWSIGDKELSQAFVARTVSLLKKEGVAGLLVRLGVFEASREESAVSKAVAHFMHSLNCG